MEPKGDTTGSSTQKRKGMSSTNNGGVAAAAEEENHSFTIKVGMVGDSEVGKTSLMVQYVENKFDEDYICTLGPPLFPAPWLSLFSPPRPNSILGAAGVNFMEKTITIRNNDINFSIWDLGGALPQTLNHLLDWN